MISMVIIMIDMINVRVIMPFIMTTLITIMMTRILVYSYFDYDF